MGQFSMEIYAPPGSTLSGNQQPDDFLRLLDEIDTKIAAKKTAH